MMSNKENELNPIKTLWPFSKRIWLTWGSMAILIILFHNLIDAFFEITAYQYFIQYIEPHWFIDIVIGISFCIVLVRYLFLLEEDYIPSVNLTFILSVIAGYYLYQRNLTHYWDSINFSFSAKLVYTDCILVFAFLQVLLFILQELKLRDRKKGWLNSRNKTNEGFMIDKPVKNSKLDELDFGKYAEQIARRIIKTNSDEAFAIGVTGKWGAGKSSYMQILEEKLEGQDIISIRFSAWRTNDSYNLVKDFLETLQKRLSSEHSSIERLISHYSTKLTESNLGSLISTIKRASQILTETDSIEGISKEIGDAIVQIGKKVVVYIDDLDRLTKEEVFEVLRLIRNTANFPNMFYIVAYDRDYIVNALNKLDVYNSHEYLEKIIQHEIQIPYKSEKSLKQLLVNALKQSLPEDLHEGVIMAAERRYPNGSNALTALVKKPRDISRIVNALSLNIDKLRGNVDVQDFVYLEVLRLAYPEVHRLLFEKRNHFFIDKEINRFTIGNRYILRTADLNQRFNSVTSVKNHPDCFLKDYLKSNKADLHISDEEIDVILDIIQGLFSETYNYIHGDGDNKFGPLRVNNPKCFQRYFLYRLFSNELDLVEFKIAHDGEINAFLEKINIWHSLGMERDISKQLEALQKFETREDFEKTICSVLHLASLPSKFRNGHGDSIYFDFDHLIKVINAVIEEGKIYGSVESLKNFMVEVITNSNASRMYLALFFSEARKSSNQLLIFNDEELIELNLAILKKWYDENQEYDDKVWRFFWCCHIEIEKETEQYIIHEEGKRLMIDIMKHKNTLKFLMSLIEVEMRDEYLRMRPATLSIFNTWENFENELDKLPSEKHEEIQPFRKFYAACKTEGFDKYMMKKWEDFFPN